MNKYTYLVGSKMLGLQNCHDEDWLTFIDEKSSIARESGCHSISFYKNIIRQFKEGQIIHFDYFKALFIYQLSSGFFDDEGYIFKDFNILEHQVVWKKWLKAYVNSEAISNRILKDSRIQKWCYHLLYQYYMIKENTHRLSEEAMSEVQKIHDLERPSSSFEELKALINSL